MTLMRELGEGSRANSFFIVNESIGLLAERAHSKAHNDSEDHDDEAHHDPDNDEVRDAHLGSYHSHTDSDGDNRLGDEEESEDGGPDVDLVVKTDALVPSGVGLEILLSLVLATSE